VLYRAQNLRGCDSQHRRTKSTRPTRDDGSHKEERLPSLGYVWTYILTKLPTGLSNRKKRSEERQNLIGESISLNL